MIDAIRIYFLICGPALRDHARARHHRLPFSQPLVTSGA